MKKLIALLLAVVLAVTGTACAGHGNTGHGSTGPADVGSVSGIEDLFVDPQVQAVMLVLDGEAAPLDDYAKTIVALRDEGSALLSYGLIWPAEYCLCYALSCTSSLRYAAELLLTARGETVHTERFSDWDTIGAISLACPSPFRLEALVCDHTGDGERADACRTMGEMNPQKVHGEEAFDILPQMSTEGLKTLKAKLEAFEDHLMSLWTAEPIPTERSGHEYRTEYHQTLAMIAKEVGDDMLALDYYEKALQTNPFLPDAYVLCAMQSIPLESPETVLAYLRGGLALDETHPGLNALAAAFWLSAGDEELYQQHLEAARASDRLTDELKAFLDDLEGGVS